MKNSDKNVLLGKQLFYRVMKIYTLLLCITMAKLFALDAKGQNISIDLQDVQLKIAIQDIEDKTDYSFFYNSSLVDVSKKVSIYANNEDLNDVLDKLLKQSSIDYRVMQKQIVLFPRNHKKSLEIIEEMLSHNILENKNEIQTKSRNLKADITRAIQDIISGQVVSEDGPVPGATVVVKGTNVGTQTDFDGNYTIAAKQGDVLEFSFVGMQTVTKTVGTSSIINVFMENTNVLDEIIVVAYGTAKKSEFTGSATQIGAKEIENRSISNISSAIEGASAGVSVNASSGQPGAGPAIRIRGFGSVSASSAPLYVVDGIIFSGSINSINPNDIESMSILKDASSTALYGNRAANGVVMITTKKGKNKKGQVSINASAGMVSRAVPEYQRLGPDKYYEIMWESMRNSRAIPGIDSDQDVADANIFASQNIIGELENNPYNVADDQIVGTDGKINPNASLLYPNDLDWTDAITQMGIRQDYNINYMGGTEKADYYASLGYLNEQGYIINSDFSRVTARAKVNFKASERIKTGLNINSAISTGNQAQATGTQSSSFVNPIRFTRNVGPIYPIHKHDPVTGEYILDANGKPIYELDDNRPSGASGGRHIVAETLWNRDLDEITTLGGRAYIDFTIMDGLVFTLNGTFDQRHWYNIGYDNKFVGDGAPGGRASRDYSRRTSIGFNQLLNYTKSFGEHNVSALLGHESIDLEINNFEGSKAQQIADNNDELVNFVTIQSLDSWTDTRTDESYFSRINYDYAGKYLVSGSVRTDGSSKFHEDRRWGVFWSFGLGWRIDKEKFAENADWLDMMKLRGSYGEIGNNSGIPFYAYQSLYDLGYNNQTEPGILQATLESKDLEWEKSASYDLALEFGLFKRLSGVVEFYHRESSNLLFDVPLTLSTGFEDITKNIGSMYNRGVELTLNFDIIRNDNFTWDFGIIASTLENQFTELSQDEIISGSKKYEVGSSIYDYWLRDWYGVDPADGAALYVPTQEAIDNAGSDIRTVGGTTVTTNVGNARYHYAGTSIPDLVGSFRNSLRYKAFTLDFMLTYQLGGKVLDYNWQGIMSTGDYGNALSVDILDRWQKPGDITNVPRMDVSEDTNFDATSDRWLVDASYLNIKQVNLIYNLPTDALNRFGVSSGQLFINGENLFIFNEREGMSNQQNFNGTTSNVYAPSRVVSLGFNINF